MLRLFIGEWCGIPSRPLARRGPRSGGRRQKHWRRAWRSFEPRARHTQAKLMEASRSDIGQTMGSGYAACPLRPPHALPLPPAAHSSAHTPTPHALVAAQSGACCIAAARVTPHARCNRAQLPAGHARFEPIQAIALHRRRGGCLWDARSGDRRLGGWAARRAAGRLAILSEAAELGQSHPGAHRRAGGR